MPSHCHLLPLLLSFFLPSALSCAYSGSGLALPPGHPALGISAPGVPYLDAAGEAVQIHDLPYDSFAVPRFLANLSAFYATDLCYWSQQVLPSPPTGFDPATGDCGASSPCAWPETPGSLADVQQMYALAAQAMGRMRAMAEGGASFLGSTCDGGLGNARVLCSALPGSPSCTPGALAQPSRWAVASNILRVTPATLPALVANVSLWRSSSDWHAPAMGSALVAKGWGVGGSITFKAMPCAAIPQPLLTASYDCDAINPASNATVWGEAFAYWSAYHAPQWLQAEVQRRWPAA